MQIEYWNKYYSNYTLLPQSSFAEYCYKILQQQVANKRCRVLYDIGCGNGRDSLYLANVLKCKVYAIDVSNTAITNVTNLNHKDITGIICDATSSCLDDLLIKKEPDVVYCRFFLHTIPHNKQRQFLEKILKLNSKIFIECRSADDNVTYYGTKISDKVYFDTHYRYLVDKKDIEQLLVSLGKTFNIMESRKFAVTSTESPLILRIIVYDK